MTEKLVHISQPRIYPHISYLSKIAQSDLYVCSDDLLLTPALFERRNLYWNFDAGDARYLLVPTNKGYLFGDTKITDLGFAARHRRILRDSYRFAKDVPFFNDSILNYLVFDAENDSFLEYFKEQLRRIFDLFGIKTEIAFASEVHSMNRKVNRLNDILRYFGATRYLSGICGKDYIKDDLCVPVVFHNTLTPRFRANPHTDKMLLYIDNIFYMGIDYIRRIIFDEEA
ncbi:MAG: WbqC family protein [Victivallaceae bacterium]|nr:WbqC family protein [Victivallaceae bacterium]